MNKMMRVFRLYQKAAGKLMGVAGIGVLAFAYVTLISAIPDKIYISSPEEKIDLSLPVKFTESEGKTTTASGNISSYRNGSAKDVEIERDSVTYTCKLFGLIPVKEVSAQVVDEQKVLPGGMPVGIYVETDGILVIGTGKVTNQSGDAVMPAEHLVKSGDYIREINGQVLKNKEQLIEAVNKCEGKRVILKILREGELIEVAVEPVECSDGDYKLGLWVRDDLAGIGTLTYVTEQMEYGALGHGVSDADTGEMLSLKQGFLYGSNIVGIVKGESGSPGELTGIIKYGEEACLGTIDKNSESGIYGSMQGMTDEYRQKEWIPVGHKQDIELGEAQILSSVDGSVKSYTIQITEVNYQKNEEYREIMFKVTDETLLGKTGGIVQGMSGSPIIQNGEIVGAVTHVLVNDPTRGYGIFIEEMLDAAG